MFIKAKIDQVIPVYDNNGQQRCGVSKKDGSKYRIYQVVISKTEERDGRKFEESFVCDYFQTYNDQSEAAPFYNIAKDGKEYNCNVSFQAQIWENRMFQRINLHSVNQIMS